MTDYISREAIAAEAQSLSTHLLNEWDTLGVLALIDRQPAADVRPVVRGRWIAVTSARGGHQCSVCHEYAPSFQNGVEHITNFCPNCGACMEES